MKCARGLALIAAAGGSASIAGAGEPTELGADETGRVRIAGHVYLNAATGEVQRTPTTGLRWGTLYWDNFDYEGACSTMMKVDDPTRDEIATGRKKFGSSVVSWGDVSKVRRLEAYDVAYASSVGCDPEAEGIPGFNMVNVFLGDYDREADPTAENARVMLGLVVHDIPGADCTLGTTVFTGWLYTVDLEGSGMEFAWGDTDLDADGRHDFAYSIGFEQHQSEPKGFAGAILARPASLGGYGEAWGCPDKLDWFNGTPLADYVGSFWFGGGDCSATPPRPYASMYFGLYGHTDLGVCDRIDFNEDLFIDFGDYLEFLGLFDRHDVRADINGDGIADFGDYLEFLNYYEFCAS